MIFEYTTNRDRVKALASRDINTYLAEVIGPKFAEYRKKWDQANQTRRVTDFPLYLVLEQQFKCNLHCPMCLHGQPEKDLYKPASTFMADDLFFKVMAEAKNFSCPSISMNNTEEPLLNKKWLARIEAAREYGFIDIMMNTNATLLTEEVAEAIIGSGLTRLLIGLDAVRPETYQKIRVGADFEKVVGNLTKFLEIREKKRSLLPVVRLSFVVTEVNRAEKDEFVRRWVDRVDYLAIQEYIPVPLDRGHSGSPRQRVFDCDQPWNRLTVRPDGQVLPCCSWWGYQMPLGNAWQDSLYDLWHSEKMNQIRRGFQTQDPHPVCRTCLS